jgi:hypothetical protein
VLEEREERDREDESKFLYSYFFNIYEKYKLLGNPLQSKDKELKKFRKEFQLFIDFFNEQLKKQEKNILLQKEQTIFLYQTQLQSLDQQLSQIYSPSYTSYTLTEQLQLQEEEQEQEEEQQNLSVLGQEGREGQEEREELQGREGRELLNTLTFEDQTRVNLIRRDISDLKQEITKLNQFKV